MPLSEHEQRLLDQMERQLYADDPKLASTLRGSAAGLHDRRRLLVGSIAVVVGMSLLIGGVAAPFWPLGVAGFLVMLGGGWLASTGWHIRSTATSTGGAAGSSAPKAKARPGFMNRIEDRWERRRDDER
ncbi:MAG TPA: DUF3040 domain-containing protein [Actinomycetes bacterium]|nr:DUF3040 domain-containing protein [Actinomycetes bacterium]